MRLPKLVFSAAVSLACASSSDGAMPPREQARQTLRAHCGACHLPNTPTSQANALKVFDLSAEVWAGTMSDQQLQELLKRFENRQRMSSAELVEVFPRKLGPAPRPTNEEVQLIREFVGSELLSRISSNQARTRSQRQPE